MQSDDSHDRIAVLGRAEFRIFAAGCSELALSVIERLGRPDSIQVCRSVLSSLWDLDNELNEEDLNRTQTFLETLPESKCDDSWKTEYYVNRAQSVLMLALNSFRDSATVRDRAVVADSAIDLAAGLDAKLDPRSATPRIVDAEERVEVGPLEILEVERQTEALDDLENNAKITPRLIGKIRKGCSRGARILGEAAEEIANLNRK